ncbi:hypothetical protein [[Mycobacterium] wendilense]|uniref:Uncharacterized protein n=1 Tax=[Mycobacterium] wendilense TaxID=3064284 RepID=A0ABM9MG80_9MYCO|nr:hypothetical protein [Mycolicibacterium sp. MU0050]CAJ1584443.1 hypothetical protein MU0050_003186 [Mycolicibacterium sp. MU0050]
MAISRSVRAAAAAAIAIVAAGCSAAQPPAGAIDAGSAEPAPTISGALDTWQDAVCQPATPDGTDSCTPLDGDGSINFDHFDSQEAMDAQLSWAGSHYAAHTVVDNRPLVIWTPAEHGEDDLHPLRDFGFALTSYEQPSTFAARPADAGPAALPIAGAAVPIPVNPYGYAGVQTASGELQCMIQAAFVGCQSIGMTWPVHLDGSGPYHGVKINPDGSLTWIDGNLGAEASTTLDHQTYRALGWTVVAGADGVQFRNDRTGHGAIVSVSRVQQF